VIAYVDTSMLIKLLIEEPGSDRAGLVWDAADVLATSQLLYVEARAALAAARRAGRTTGPAHRTAVSELEALWEQMSIVEVTEELVSRAAELAESDGLRGYDAMHLASALSVGADTLASADTDLCAAALRHAMHVANPNDMSDEEALHLNGAPVQLVLRWLQAVFDEDDLAAAWVLTDPPLRLALVQSWIISEEPLLDARRDDVAEALAAAQQPTHPLWAEFAQWRTGRWASLVFEPWVTKRELRGTVSRYSLISAEIEAIEIADSGTVVPPDGRIVVQRFLVRHSEDSVRLAGIGGVLPQPGWPPTETERFPM
jgi:uncharacterized protein